MRTSIVLVAIVASLALVYGEETVVLSDGNTEVPSDLITTLNAMMGNANANVDTLSSSSTPNAACTFGGLDLSSLTKTSGDYTGKDETYDYKMNVCAASNAGTGCTDKGFAICQYLGTSFVASLGAFTGAQPTWSYIDPTNTDKGVQYQFTNGDQCWIAGAMTPRTVNVLFPCGSATASTITVTEDKAKCIFTITLQTTASCKGGKGPGGDSLSGGSVFLILLFTIVPVYILAGCIYKNRKLGTTGRESCPNIDLWSLIPGLAMDGCRYTLMMMKTGCKGSKSYTQM